MAIQDILAAVANGDQLDDGFFLGLYYGNRIVHFDETTDLNVSASASGTTSDSNNKSYSFTATELQGANYIEIILLGTFRIDCPGTGSTTTSGSVSIDVEVTSPSSVTIYDEAILSGSGSENHEDDMDLPSLTIIHELSAGEKSSGLTIQITMDAAATRSGTGANSSASFTNTSITLGTRY